MEIVWSFVKVELFFHDNDINVPQSGFIAVKLGVKNTYTAPIYVATKYNTPFNFDPKMEMSKRRDSPYIQNELCRDHNFFIFFKIEFGKNK